MGIVGASAALPATALKTSFGEGVVPVGTPVRNRAPLASQPFYTLPLGSVRARGWLLRQLKIQADGLGGHLDEFWPDVGPQSGWLGGPGESWERGPYFLDGLIPLAYLLNDAHLKAKAQKFLDWTLNNQEANGNIGPSKNDDWWPRMVILKVLTQYQEATGDSRVIPLMERYFEYQLSAMPLRPLRDWGKFRWQDEVLSVIWLYNRTGNAKLLDLARLLHKQGYSWQAQFADFKYRERITPEFIHLNEGGGLKDTALATHGVNNGMAIKAGPTWSVLSGLPSDRQAVMRMLSELDRYHGLPNGIFSCDEHFAGRNPSQGSELCTVVETMFSLEQSLAITGEAILGDRLEKLAFNALPGTFTDDMWAHQYNQEPNQVECSLHRQPWTTDGPESNLYGLEPNFGCCTANFHQGWPKFAASLWMLSEDDGLFAAAYAPSEVKTTVRNTPVRIVEETEYPFRETISISVDPARAVRFPLKLRIPAWAEDASVRVNGQKQEISRAESIAVLDRVWNAGDKVEIVFPMKPRASHWYNDAVAFERGPIVFSLPIGTEWRRFRDRGPASDWEVHPTTQWNYAIAETSGENLQVKESPIGEVPFALRDTPVALQVKARRLRSWEAKEGVAAPVPQSPVESSEKEEELTLVPYAAAKLRITAFPQLKPTTTKRS